MDLSETPVATDGGTHPIQLAASLRRLASQQGIDETLQLVVDLARELVAGCEVADVMLVGPDGVVTPVRTDPVAVLIDQAQAETEEGPCLYVALDHEVAVRSNDLAADGRWPSFGRRAATLGYRSALSFQLFLNEDRRTRLGALNLYSSSPDAFDDQAMMMGEVFASQCAAVLNAAIREQGLHAALRSRDLIGQAKGILMERHQLDAAVAFELLRRASQRRNIKLHEVARQMVTHGRFP